MNRFGKVAIVATLACALAIVAQAQPGPGRLTIKPIVCRPLESARGKTGAALAQAIEQEAMQLAQSWYSLAAVLPGDPPIACFQVRPGLNDLPPGAK